MELRRNLPRIPIRPLVFLVVVLSAVALALFAAYAVATKHALPSSGGDYISAPSGFPGPDAQDRNEQLSQSRDPEAHHGH